MCSEDLECGICCEPYDAARHCPRELRCGHSFCESCLGALRGRGDVIACPLCRRTTRVPAAGVRLRAALRVDEGVWERMVSAGVLPAEDRNTDDDDETPEPSCRGDGGGDDSLSLSRGGRFRLSWKKVWRKIVGSGPQGDGARNYITNDEFRDYALMSFYTF
ncbi:hypothetical protein NHX12_013984 [Muraenolepis orangiensis]|uniref:RING-type domain-containing protein n=1 Tax=Muraenolepis orangiensis TaxID=630683 RepID=A0A9Q0DB33_9TELE|nr:hypothetical protein NHX12_013984 [Muraenolepis orangiensis]